MPLCFLAVIGAPLFLSLGWTHARFSELAQLEKAVIGLDNASIVLGQSARAVWRGLQYANQQMRVLEIAHHAAHVCARAPLPNPGCRAADLAFERRLRSMHAWSGQVARVEWMAGVARAQNAAKPLAEKLRIVRSAEPPMQSVQCPVCLLPMAWEIRVPHRESAIVHVHERVFRNEIESVGKTLKGMGEWQYRVREVESAY